MKIVEIVVIFLLLFVVLAGLSVPLWWERAQPYIFNFPHYIEGIIRDLKDAFDYIMKSI